MFTESVAEVREEEEEGCGSQLPVLAEKNDQGKWEHNGAHRNSCLRPKNVERSFRVSFERIQTQ